MILTHDIIKLQLSAVIFILAINQLDAQSFVLQ